MFLCLHNNQDRVPGNIILAYLQYIHINKQAIFALSIKKYSNMKNTLSKLAALRRYLNLDYISRQRCLPAVPRW